MIPIVISDLIFGIIFLFLFLFKFINKNFCFICSYDRAKQRHSKNKEGKLSPGLHLASAAEAGALVSYANF